MKNRILSIVVFILVVLASTTVFADVKEDNKYFSISYPEGFTGDGAYISDTEISVDFNASNSQIDVIGHLEDRKNYDDDDKLINFEVLAKYEENADTKYEKIIKSKENLKINDFNAIKYRTYAELHYTDIYGIVSDNYVTTLYLAAENTDLLDGDIAKQILNSFKIKDTNKKLYKWDDNASEEKTYGSFKYYTVDYSENYKKERGMDGEAIIVGPKFLTSTSLSIPAAFGKYEVTKIFAFAFENMPNLEKVEINNNADLSILDGAFAGCTNLKEIKFNENMVTLYSKVFQDTEIKELTFPTNKHMYVDAFEGMNKLEKIFFRGKDNKESPEFVNAVWDHDEYKTDILTAETKTYLKENVTVYGYALGSEFDNKNAVFCLTPKAFADRFGLKFVELSEFIDYTDEQLLEMLPAEISLNRKESDIVEKRKDTITDIEEKIKNILEENKVDVYKYEISAYFNDFEDYTSSVLIEIKENNKNIGSKTVKIVYNNSNDYNADDAKNIKIYMETCTVNKEGTYKKNNLEALYLVSKEHLIDTIEGELDGVRTVCIVTSGTDTYGAAIGKYGTDAIEGWSEEDYICNGTLYIIKNDVIYMSKQVHLVFEPVEIAEEEVDLKSGISVNTEKSSNVVVNAKEINESNNNYSKIVERAKNNGYNQVYKAFEVKLINGDLKEGIDIIFDLGTENNEKQAIVIHLKADGTYEEFEETVTDGKVSIHVTELSPFLVALKTKNTEWENPFNDIPEGKWYYDSVKYVYQNGIMTGLNETTFAPSNNLTRGQMVTLLYKMEGMPEVEGTPTFPDVQDSSKYYYNAVKWASDNNIVTGYANGNFGPKDFITRAQLAVILYRYAQFKGKNVSTTGDLSQFPDKGDVAKWAQDAVTWAVEKGIISGNENKQTGVKTIDPKQNATRAQVATMIERYCKNIGR